MSVRLVVLPALLAFALSACSHADLVTTEAQTLSDEDVVIAMAIASQEDQNRSREKVDESNDEVVAITASSSDTRRQLGFSSLRHEDPGEPVIVAPRRYTLDSGDQIRVFIYGQPNLSRIYTVDGAGYISIPLISGVAARGLTTFDLERKIAARLARDLVRDPQVSIEITTHRPFYILGEVRTAGRYPFAAGLTARRAVAIAGGFTPRADKHDIKVTRTLDSVRQTMALGLDEDVLPGDVITIEERWF